MSKKNQYGERVLWFLNKEWKAIEILPPEWKAIEIAAVSSPHLAVNLYINRVNKKNGDWNILGVSVVVDQLLLLESASCLIRESTLFFMGLGHIPKNRRLHPTSRAQYP